MTHINNLTSNLLNALPFTTEAEAETFLSEYSIDDQCAMISAMYIGRDHIHDDQIRDDYIPQRIKFDRYFVTGDFSRWLIRPADFARIIYEKEHCLNTYLTAFSKCCSNSGIDLQQF